MSAITATWRDSVGQSLAQAQDQQQFTDVLAKAGKDLGFDYTAFGLRLPVPITQPKVFMLNNYSVDWQQRYVAANYLSVDPTVQHGMRSVSELVWSEQVFSGAPDMWEEARSAGLRVGWSQSSYDAQGAAGLLTLARSHDALTDAELRENSIHMNWLGQMARETASRLLGDPAREMPESPLSSREIEVLRWTALGKTSGEVGQIMNITERTVNFHINNSLLKLGAVNKTACVVKAALLRLI